VALPELKSVISAEKKRFKIEQTKDCFKVLAGTFSDLNSLAHALFQETGFRPLVLEPERQFLLEKNWSFFDCFSFFSEKEFVKTNGQEFPKAKIELFSEPLNETMRQLLKDRPLIAQKTINSIALSTLLKKPLNQLPETKFLQQETFLENILWKTGLSARKPEAKHRPRAKKWLFSKSNDLAEVDFSRVWPMLLTKPFYNIGFDTVNCGCCKPKSISERNVLPNSLVLVEMQQDGFFFESSCQTFAKRFHESKGEKESRLRRKQEFFLNTIPVGPFFRKQAVAVPLADAIQLRQESKARILRLEKASWFCLEKESALSKAVAGMSRTIAFAENNSEKISLNSVKSHKVLSLSLLSQDLEYLFSKAILSNASNIVSSLPEQLCSEASAFFKEALCSAIESIQSNVLRNFNDFASKKQARVVALQENRAFLRSERPNTLVKQFSQKHTIPAFIATKPF